MSQISATPIAKCRHCAAPLTHTFVDLGMSPLCESFIKPAELNSMERFYPLHALVCSTCFLVQLQEYVTPDHIFSDYIYFSSYSTSWVEHARKYCVMMKDRLQLSKDSFVVEIASNDGYLLQHFLPMSVPVLGIEPAANVAKVATQKGVPSHVAFFGTKTAAEVAKTHGQADLIAGNNVLAHVPDINDFIGGVKVLLKPEGVNTFEFPHLETLMNHNQFDTIYHEHFSYLSATVVERIARSRGLRMIDVEEIPTHGGSLRVYLAHKKSSHTVSAAVTARLAHEAKLGFSRIEHYLAYTAQVRETKRKLLSFLIDAKNSGKKICGYGAPGKGNTLLNYCGIGVDFLDFTVDRSPHKHGLYTPGMHIPILPVEAIDTAKPDYILILPWNLKDEIVEQMRQVKKWGAKFVVPIPEVQIIEPK